MVGGPTETNREGTMQVSHAKMKQDESDGDESIDPNWGVWIKLEADEKKPTPGQVVQAVSKNGESRGMKLAKCVKDKQIEDEGPDKGMTLQLWTVRKGKKDGGFWEPRGAKPQAASSSSAPFGGGNRPKYPTQDLEDASDAADVPF